MGARDGVSLGRDSRLRVLGLDQHDQRRDRGRDRRQGRGGIRRRGDQRADRRGGFQGSRGARRLLLLASPVRRSRGRGDLRDVLGARVRDDRKYSLLRARGREGRLRGAYGDVHSARHSRAMGSPALHRDDGNRLRHRARVERRHPQIRGAGHWLHDRGDAPRDVERVGGAQRRAEVSALLHLAAALVRLRLRVRGGDDFPRSSRGTNHPQAPPGRGAARQHHARRARARLLSDRTHQGRLRRRRFQDEALRRRRLAPRTLEVAHGTRDAGPEDDDQRGLHRPAPTGAPQAARGNSVAPLTRIWPTQRM